VLLVGVKFESRQRSPDLLRANIDKCYHKFNSIQLTRFSDQVCGLHNSAPCVAAAVVIYNAARDKTSICCTPPHKCFEHNCKVANCAVELSLGFRLHKGTGTELQIMSPTQN
jgi:hypothetical protein